VTAVHQEFVTTPRLANVLLAEDDPADARLIRRAFDLNKLALRLTWVEDGEAAMNYLLHPAPAQESERPDLLLLDLNMPKMNGHEVLAAIRAEPGLTTLPVVILTTSRADEDVIESYRLRANAYVPKPIDLDGLFKIVTTIQEFWFSIVVLPSERPGRHGSAPRRR
jgi:two-component system, chemotaxis family, response regulator Rcp1